MYKKERNLKILEARRSGKTLRQIGSEFGINAERVRQIVRMEERKEKHGIPYEGISFRTVNTIARATALTKTPIKPQDFNSKEVLIEKIKNLKREDFLKMRNFGIGSLRELEQFIGLNID